MKPLATPRAVLAVVTTLILFCVVVSGILSGSAHAQEPPISLGELARRERERKRTSTRPARVLTLDDSTLNCQSDWDCLLAAVERKQEAHMTFSERLDFSTAYGTIHSSEIHLEIRDYGEETAVMRAWPQNSRLQLSNDSKEAATKSGLTPQQIESQERSLERNIQRQDGLTASCVFRLSRLEQFIRRIRNDQEDEGAWRLAERCDGLDQAVTNPHFTEPPQPISLPEKSKTP